MKLIFDGDNPLNQGFDVAFEDGGTAATAYYCVDGEGRETAERLAHLFAAAPDLLAVCEKLLEEPEEFMSQTAWDKKIGEAVKLARAAIAKVRGE